jgi:hypothetical protein
VKRKTNTPKKKHPTLREILNANPRMQNNLFMAAVCFGFVALCFLGLAVYGAVLWLGSR